MSDHMFLLVGASDHLLVDICMLGQCIFRGAAVVPGKNEDN